MAETPVLKRVTLLWREKAVLGVVVALLFGGGYFATQRLHLGTARQLPLSRIDRVVPFSPEWVVIYQSSYLMMNVGWLAVSRKQLRQYGVGFLVMGAVGFTCFAFFPIAGPRPTGVDAGLLRYVYLYDGPTNCLPSLHMATSAFAALFCLSLFPRRPRWLAPALVAWVGLIGYSTLATKQHYFVDLPPGVLLGVVAHLIATRERQQRREARTAQSLAATSGSA